MTEHALELLHVAVWIITGLGGAGIATMIWGGKKVLERLDRVESLLRDELHKLDKRLTVVETNVGIMNPESTQPGYQGQRYRRRLSDALDDSRGD